MSSIKCPQCGSSKIALCPGGTCLFPSEWAMSHIGYICEDCLCEFGHDRHFDRKTEGISGILYGIKWVGFREWIRLCWHWRKFATEGDIWEWKSGN